MTQTALAKSTKMIWNNKSIQKYLEIKNSLDPISEIREDCRQLVLDALDKGWSGPPFNPLELADILGIPITPNESVPDARIIPTGVNKYLIEYNPFQIESRVNFSIAHELAHTLFPDCANQIRNRAIEEEEDKQLELLCNIGASEILLPYGQFTQDATTTKPEIEGLLELSNKYKASLEAVLLRYVEVIDQPCAIAVGHIGPQNSNLTVDYFKSNSDFPGILKIGYKIPKNSIANECVTPGWTSRKVESWSTFSEKTSVFAIGLSTFRNSKTKRVGLLFFPYSTNKIIDSRKINLEYGDATKPRGKGNKMILQLVNSSGGLGFGFGKSLSKNYPVVKTKLESWKSNKKEFNFGEIQVFKVAPSILVCQMLAQKGLFAKDGQIPLNYSALRLCLQKIKTYIGDNKIDIVMPQIGAGQAKGDWSIIQSLIYEELVLNGINTTIYLLPGSAYNPKLKSSLILFKENTTWQQEKLF